MELCRYLSGSGRYISPSGGREMGKEIYMYTDGQEAKW